MSDARNVSQLVQVCSRALLGIVVVASAVFACSGTEEPGSTIDGGTDGGGGSPPTTSMATSTMTATTGGPPAFGAATTGMLVTDGGCGPVKTCAELGWQCGYTIDECGREINCEDEGLVCGANELCSGVPTACVQRPGPECPVCDGLPQCPDETTVTRLEGRVVTPGRSDTDTANQVGVPNAVVYIPVNAPGTALPTIPTGIPEGGTSCDRCEEQNLGDVLVGAITDATGKFVLEGRIPVGVEFMLVVKAGRFRRVATYSLPAEAACQTTTLPTALPENPTRLPRSMSDGDQVNIPRIAVSTGQVDAMECVLEKMGLDHAEFSNPGADGAAAPRVHLYRGAGGGNAPFGGMGPGPGGMGPGFTATTTGGTTTGATIGTATSSATTGGTTTGGAPPVDEGLGARIDDMTPLDAELYGATPRLFQYDIVIADCEGIAWDGTLQERDENGANVREFVNRGGRMFASHLSFTWLYENGTAAFSEADPIATGLDPAATWTLSTDLSDTGEGVVSLDRLNASPRIQTFADWMNNEGIALAPDYTFTIIEPRSQNTGLGEFSEEFVYLGDGNERVQQFSFNTPYGAPEELSCGRVAYSGFHVSVGGGDSPFADAIFPEHCSGDLTDQEKVLLFMLFDLGACVGEVPPSPPCVPVTCEDLDTCGRAFDGCGGLLDCGACPPPE